jgi:hypothetical protein
MFIRCAGLFGAAGETRPASASWILSRVRVHRTMILLAGAFLVLFPASASGAPPTCARAEALYQSHYYADAEQEYKRLLGSGESCAVVGVRKARHAVQAENAFEAGAAGKLREAERLQDAGFETEARSLVKELTQNSTVHIPAKLRALDQRVSWWRDLLGSAAPVARLILEMLLVAAIGMLLVLLTGWALPALVSRLKTTVRLIGFSGSAETTLSSVLAAALSTTLSQMQDYGPGRQLVYQTGTEPKFELPKEIAEAVPQAGMLAGVLSMMGKALYSRLYSVSGTIHPVHKHRGAGLTLTVAGRSGNTIEQETFWEQDFALKPAGSNATDSVRYERLVLPAAVWLAFRPKLGFKQGKAVLGATDWRSYALFSLGKIAPDTESERVLYEQALDRDPGNLGARLNLAGLLLQRPGYELSTPSKQTSEDLRQGSKESWRERVDGAWRHLCVVAGSTDRERDAIWYRALYLQAIVCIYRAEPKLSNNGPEGQVQAKRATTILECLRGAIDGHAHDERTAALVDALADPVKVLSQTAGLLQGERPDLSAFPADRWLSADGEYNLACLYSRYAATVARDSSEFKERQAEAVRHLRRSIDRRQDDRQQAAIKEATVDPAFDAVRTSAGFRDTLRRPKASANEPEATRYAVTIDPGPVLSALAGK